MVNRTRDIINLREAARRCRGNAEASQGARAETFRELAAEIDGLILSLIAEIDAARAVAASRASPTPVPDVGERPPLVPAVAG
jgi:hypothetical protein